MYTMRIYIAVKIVLAVRTVYHTYAVYIYIYIYIYIRFWPTLLTKLPLSVLLHTGHRSQLGLARTIYMYGTSGVYIRYFWQGYHQIYGHVRCLYTVLADLNHSQ